MRAELRHSWLEVAAQLHRVQAAQIMCEAERERNAAGVARLDLMFKAFQRTEAAMLSFAHATFARHPVNDAEAIHTRDTLLAFVELSIHRRSRDRALEAWELEYRRFISNMRPADQEAYARERLYFYEAQVQVAKAKLCRLNAPGKEEWSKNLVPLANTADRSTVKRRAVSCPP